MRRLLISGLLCWAGIESGAANTNLPVQGVSLANPSVAVPAAGNGESAASVISADGRFVLFASTASNLVTNDANGLVFDLFLRNRTNSTTTLISANMTGTGGGNGHSIFSGISTNGRWVAFESAASNLVPNDTNDATDIFVRDLQTGATITVSVSTGGNRTANGASTGPILTPNGRYVSFASKADDLVLNDTNGIADVFVRDLQTGTTALVSVGAEARMPGLGGSDTPAMTPDGRYIAFVSTASNLVAGVTNSSEEVYVRDRVGGTTAWASTNTASLVQSMTGLTTNSISSYRPVISADGRYVVFEVASSHTNTVLILRHDLVSVTTEVVSQNAVGESIPLADASGPLMTSDARFVAYVGRIYFTNSNSSDHVYLWDAQTATNILVSVSRDGSANTNSLSDTPALSSDGRFIAFLSNAPDLVTNAVNGEFQVYLRDVVAGTTTLVSQDVSGVASGAADAAIPTISADGRYVAFDSFDDNYVPGDDNSATDVFVRDTVTEVTELISQSSSLVASVTGNNLSSVSAGSISANGRFVAFVSMASNLVPADTNGFQDVFVRDLQAGTNILVSASGVTAGTASGRSKDVSISGNGRHVVFLNNASDLVANDTNGVDDVFARDIQTGKTVLVSVSSNNLASGNAASSTPVISTDGRYVAFFSYATDLASGSSPFTSQQTLLWRDLQTETTVAVAVRPTPGAVMPPSISADGRFVAYVAIQAPQAPLARLLVWDAQTRTHVHTNNFDPTAYALSAAGSVLVSQVGTQVWVHDVVAHSDVLVGSVARFAKAEPQISGDGRFVVYVSGASDLASNDFNGVEDVFLYDRLSKTTILVSVNRDWTGSANGPSDSPSISADGRYVAFRSQANDIVGEDENGEPDVFFFDRLTGTNTLASVARTGLATGNGRSAAPFVSADGSMVVFRSVASDLTDGDLNNNQDVFFYCIRQTVVLDSDADGMDDAWEQSHFGNLAKNGIADSDGDGMSDLKEYKTGTNPANAESVFRGEIVSPATGEHVRIAWPAAPGRTYQVQYKNALDEPGWNDLAGNVSVSGATAMCTDQTASPFNQRFYRVALVE